MDRRVEKKRLVAHVASPRSTAAGAELAGANAVVGAVRERPRRAVAPAPSEASDPRLVKTRNTPSAGGAPVRLRGACR